MSVQPPPLPDRGTGSAPLATSRGLAALATPGKRLVARFIDNLVTLAPVVIWEVVGGRPSGNGLVLAFYASSLGLWLLNDVALTTVRGGTIGKLVLGTRVVRLEDWQMIGASSAMRRWAAMVVLNLIPFAGILDGIWLLWDPQRQTLHDKFAWTTVVVPISPL